MRELTWLISTKLNPVNQKLDICVIIIFYVFCIGYNYLCLVSTILTLNKKTLKAKFISVKFETM